MTTPSAYQTLAAALASTYAGQTVDQIAAAMQTASVPVYSVVPAEPWQGYFFSRGFAVAIQNYAGLNGGAAPAGASALSIAAAKMLAQMMPPSQVPVDLADSTARSEVQTMLSALVAEGTAGRLVSIAGTPFAQVDADALLALGTTTITPAQQMGFGPQCDMVNEVLAVQAAQAKGWMK